MASFKDLSLATLLVSFLACISISLTADETSNTDKLQIHGSTNTVNGNVDTTVLIEAEPEIGSASARDGPQMVPDDATRGDQNIGCKDCKQPTSGQQQHTARHDQFHESQNKGPTQAYHREPASSVTKEETKTSAQKDAHDSEDNNQLLVNLRTKYVSKGTDRASTDQMQLYTQENIVDNTDSLTIPKSDKAHENVIAFSVKDKLQRLSDARRVRRKRDAVDEAVPASPSKPQKSLKNLEKAENRFEKRNKKIARRLTALRKNTAEELSKLNSEILQHSDDQYPRADDSDKREGSMELPSIQGINLNVIKNIENVLTDKESNKNVQDSKQPHESGAQSRDRIGNKESLIRTLSPTDRRTGDSANTDNVRQGNNLKERNGKRKDTDKNKKRRHRNRQRGGKMKYSQRLQNVNVDSGQEFGDGNGNLDNEDGFVSDGAMLADQHGSDHFVGGNRLVRPSAADRLEQRISPVLNRNYRQLMEHLNGILQRFTEAMKTVDSYYWEVFNGTRYDIMMGTREVYEDLNKANDDIYDAVMSTTRFTKQVMLKAHRDRDNRRLGKVLDQPVEVTRTSVEDRDFQPLLQRAYEEQRKVQEEMRDAEAMKMKCMQGEGRMQQVREAFSQNYDLPSLRDVIEYLNITIIRMNRGNQAHSPALRELARGKFYLDYLKGNVKEASDILKNSTDAVQKGYMEMRKNRDMYQRWEREQQGNTQRRGDRSQADSRQSLSYRQYQELQGLVSEAKRHAYQLESQRNRMESILSNSIIAAKGAMASSGTGTVDLAELTPLVHILRMLTADMTSSLDLLRRHIGSKTKITYHKTCRSPQEGSGWIDDGDDDELCDEEGSGAVESESDRIFVTDDEDFSFTSEPVDSVDSSVYTLKQFGADLRDFTDRQLRDSQQIYDRAQILQRSLAGLQQQHRSIEENVATNERFADEQKDFILDLEDSVRDFQEVKRKFKQISYKISEINRYDLDGAVERANRAIESAKKYAAEDKKRPPRVTRPMVKTTTEILPKTTMETLPKTTTKTLPPLETTEKAKEVVEGKIEKPVEAKKDDITEKETDREEVEDDFDYSGLFRQGREILSNRDDIRSLQSMAIESCGRIGSHFTNIRSNMSTLRQKVEKAREMLATLQVSISKSGSGHIPVPVPQIQNKPAASLTTNIRACIKPKTVDGTVLVFLGNNSASYTVTLDDGEVTVTVYDADNDELDSLSLDEKLIADQWCTLEIQRTGDAINLTALTQDGKLQQASKQISDLKLMQTQPITAYIGGAPDDIEIESEPWEGCVGDLSVNGQALTMFRTDSKGKEPALCTDHCSKEKEKLSMVFSGDGFVHFERPEREIVNTLTLRFRTRQKTASLLSVSNMRRRFYLSVVLVNGALKVESSSYAENVVLLSFDNSLNDGQNHLLRIVYRSSRTYPELDGKRESFSVEKANPQILRDVLDGVLIGSFISTSRQYLSSQYRPLIGCVADISINDNKLTLPDAVEVYNSYQGHCTTSGVDIWHSCWQWTENSEFLSFGTVENSNKISLLVSRDSRGPLIHYVKEDKFDIEVSMTEDGIDVSSDDKEGVMIRPETDNNWFTLVTITDDGDDVFVKAWEESVDISYGGFWGFANVDLTAPHTVAIGESKDADERMFTGSIAQFSIGDRFYDLSQFSSSHTLSSCERPLEEIRPKLLIRDLEEPFSCA